MSHRRFLGLSLLTGLCLAGPAPAAEPHLPFGWVRPAVAGFRESDGGRMLIAILKGDPPVAGFGWFGPAQSRYGWKWVASHFDADRDGAVTRKEFKGPAQLFDRLDRNHDGRLTAEDFDWSSSSPLVKQEQLAAGLFRRIDGDEDRKITRAEWNALFKKAARGKDSLTPEDLQLLLFPPPRQSPGAFDMPSRWTLLHGLFTGEIGCPTVGPAVGDVAPDFTLKTHDGKQKVTLAQYRGKKPVVLVFGSFT